MVPPILNKHFPHTYASEIRHVNRTYLWPYEKVTITDRQTEQYNSAYVERLSLTACTVTDNSGGRWAEIASQRREEFFWAGTGQCFST
jgi:hypothetical protein